MSCSLCEPTLAWYKPEGRGRKFRRQARGLARRMRLYFIRQTLWEKDNPQANYLGREHSYGYPWTSEHMLIDYSPACVCHKRERYDRKKGR